MEEEFEDNVKSKAYRLCMEDSETENTQKALETKWGGYTSALNKVFPPFSVFHAIEPATLKK